VILGCAFALVPHAQAQTNETGQWQFYITPYLWIAGVSGTLQTPNPRIPDQSASAGFGDVLSHLDAIPIMGSAEIRNDRFGLLTDIIAISVKTDASLNGPLFSGGSVRLTQVIGTATGSYRVVDAPNQALDIGIGVRAFGMATNFTVNPGLLPGFTKTPGASWADPIGAVRYHIDLDPSWGFTLYGDGGGGPDAQVTWQVLGTVDYRITPSTVMRIGFRHLQFQYMGNRLQQNMSMTGPILGATFRF
jgi:hypothetical protein